MEKCLKAINLLGVSVHKLTMLCQVENISISIYNNKHQIFANHNLHSIYIYHHDNKMRSFYDISDYINIDGMPLVLIGRLLGHSLTRDNRMTCLNWIPLVLTDAEKRGWRIFYLGSRPGIAEQGSGVLKLKYPKLQISSFHGYFDADPGSDENQQIISKINEYRPHILMVGMGMPRQEHWIVDNLAELNANVIINVGAYIDYVAGVIPTPPRWMGRVGLEWLYRLLSEPKRLWFRYLVEPWYLAGIFLQDIIRLLFNKKERNV
jgi:N-acetylglucosaminyldiphosphoundecaprenol N-acetyl-beta-D-mannosaminyltransferase